MTSYAVGDIQGCLEPLQRLLDKISFSPGEDELWATGDIVNRGPDSLATMRFLKSLGSSFRMVLGNHDLHLIATARGYSSPSPKDTLDDIYNAPDVEQLLDWLQAQPLLIHDQGYVMTHAGLPPQWSLETATQRAREVEDVLSSDKADEFFRQMYGNTPVQWRDNLTNGERWRVITNYFTRMRFCSPEGKLELDCKRGPEYAPVGYRPWYAHPERLTATENIIFGHWATLDGRDCGDHLFPLDTGCVWGKRLRVLSLSDRTYSHCQCGEQ